MDLSTNWAGDEGAKAIAGALEVNSVLTDLNLRFNSIGDEGAKSIASALHVNGVLTNLDLRANDLGEDARRALAEANGGARRRPGASGTVSAHSPTLGLCEADTSARVVKLKGKRVKRINTITVR